MPGASPHRRCTRSPPIPPRQCPFRRGGRLTRQHVSAAPIAGAIISRNCDWRLRCPRRRCSYNVNAGRSRSATVTICFEFEGANGQTAPTCALPPTSPAGRASFVPASYLRRGLHHQPSKTPGSQWTFIDFSGDLQHDAALGLLRRDLDPARPEQWRTSDGLFEVTSSKAAAPRTARLSPTTSSWLRRPSPIQSHQGEPQQIGQARAAPPAAKQPPAPDPALGTLTFPQFVSAVWRAMDRRPLT